MPTGQQYGTNVPQTTLTAGITAVATSFAVASLSGYPSTPFTAVLDIGTSTQEPIDVLGVSGNTITSCNRNIDGTSGFAHAINATFTHADIGRDFREARSHIDASAGVHGVTGSVVGTTDVQNLTNKTLTAGTISNGETFTSSSAPVETSTNVGLYNNNGVLSYADATTTSTPVITQGTYANFNSFITWTFDGVLPTTNLAASVNGGVMLSRIVLTTTTTVTNINGAIGVAGSSLTSGKNFAGIYDNTGTLKGTTADLTTSWGTTGNKVMPLTSPVTLPAGTYYIAILGNASTSIPQWLGMAFNSTGNFPGTAPYRSSFVSGPNNTLPASITLGSVNQNTNGFMWLTLS